MQVRLALVQMNCPKGDVAGNLRAMERYIAAAVREKVDFICFPEMSITGYLNPTAMPEAMLSLDDEAIRRFVGLTAGKDITALAGLVEINPNGKPIITQVVARQGRLLGYYRKVNVAPDELPSFAPPPVAEYPIFEASWIKFGVAICADVGHGDLFEAYARQGAKLVFAASAPGLYGSQKGRDWRKGFAWWHDECQKHLSKFAREGGIVIAVCTQAERTVDEDFPGGGYVFDSSGKRIVASEDGREGTLYAVLDI